MTSLETDRFFKDFHVQEEVGRGSYGAVYRVYDLRARKTFALKEVCIDSIESLEMVVSEAKVPKRHRNIVGCSLLLAAERPAEVRRAREAERASPEVCSIPNSQCIYRRLREHNLPYCARRSKCEKIFLYLKMEYYEFSLRDFLDFRNWLFFKGSRNHERLLGMLVENRTVRLLFKNDSGFGKCVPLLWYLESICLFPERKINRVFFFCMFRHIINGIAHLHSLGILHKDIKAGNILLEQNSVLVPKICDFGLMEVDSTGFSSSVIKNTARLRKGHSGVMEDLKAAGLVYYEMLSPFKTKMERTSKFSEVLKRRSLPAEFVSEFRVEARIIDLCLNLSGTSVKSARCIQRVLMSCSLDDLKD
jgi:serine/threonine protein kinase